MYKRNVISSFVSQCAKILLKFVVSVLVARTLGKEKYGQVTYFLLVFNMLSSYGHLGTLNGAGYFSKADAMPARRQFDVNLTYLLLNWFGLGVLLFLPPVRQTLLSGYGSFVLLLGAVYVLLQYASALMTAYYVSEERLYLSNRYLLAGSVAASVCLVVIWLCGAMSGMAYIVVLVLEFLFVVLLQYRSLHYRYRPAWDGGFLLREWRYGSIVFWASLFIYLNYRVDQFMIRQRFGDGPLGVYSVAVSIADLVLFVPDSFASAITGRLININGQEQQQRQVVCLTIKCCLYACIGIAAMGMLLAPLLKYIYGMQYAEAVPCLNILLVGICGAAVARVLYPFYYVRGQATVHLAITFATFLSNIIMNCLLIPRYGIYGAAVASTISYMFYGGCYVVIFYKKEKVPLRAMFIFSRQELQKILHGLKR